MSSKFVPWLSAGILCVSLVLAWFIFGDASPSAAEFKNGAELPGAAQRDEEHFVTPAQLAELAVDSPNDVASFEGVSSAGQSTSWIHLSTGRPLVIVFIRDGCPCSVRFEPIFHRLERGLRPGVGFVGVIDASIEVARAYVQKNQVPYPVLADPDHRLIKLFHAKNAAYVALVNREGIVESLWPGCSADMMRDLNRKAALLAGFEEPPFNPSEMPGPLTTGCPF